jgi:hypothetical protein
LQTWVIVAAWALLAALVLGARAWWRRPRLEVETSLRGTTRSGTLYVRVHNRGRLPARGVRVEIAWVAPSGTAVVEGADLGEIEGGDAGALTVRDLHRALGEKKDWTALRIEARAANARPAQARIDLSLRTDGPPAQEVPPVQYRRETRCPESPDGQHLFRTARFLNDGVRETWHVCARCGHLQRDPLAPAEEALQSRVRRERAQRERQKLEEELDRMREQEPQPRRRPPPPETPGSDAMPPAVAFWVLGLDEQRATWDDVLHAHRRLALESHPDRGGEEPPERRAAREQRMADVNRARDRLREHFGR